MPGGRPLKFETPELMQKQIDLYFLACKVHQTGNDDLLMGLSDAELLVVNDVDDVIPTVTGLALALDTSRRVLLNYEDRDEYVHTIKKAKLRIENGIEQRLFHNNATGSIFNLKNNFDWKDTQDLNVGGQKDNQLPATQCDARILELLNKSGKGGIAGATGEEETSGDQE